MDRSGAQTMPGDIAEMTNALQEPGLSLTHGKSCDSALLALIESAREGDAAAFEEIMIRYERRVLRTAWRILGSREDAQDAAQDVFLRIFRYLKSYRGTQDFEGWLYRIIVNACRDIARKRPPLVSTRSDAEGTARDLAGIAAAGDLEESAIQSQQRAIIVEALATLSTKEREALVLRDLEGFSTKEVARMLGSSQITVRSQISSARKKIKLFKDRLMKKRQG
jgi:RNA polymerase sigma-70 factor (ECF subfamily)